MEDDLSARRALAIVVAAALLGGLVLLMIHRIRGRSHAPASSSDGIRIVVLHLPQPLDRFSSGRQERITQALGKMGFCVSTPDYGTPMQDVLGGNDVVIVVSEEASLLPPAEPLFSAVLSAGKGLVVLVGSGRSDSIDRETEIPSLGLSLLPGTLLDGDRIAWDSAFQMEPAINKHWIPLLEPEVRIGRSKCLLDRTSFFDPPTLVRAASTKKLILAAAVPGGGTFLGNCFSPRSASFVRQECVLIALIEDQSSKIGRAGVFATCEGFSGTPPVGEDAMMLALGNMCRWCSRRSD